MISSFTSMSVASALRASRYSALLLPLLAIKAEALVMPQRVTVIGHGTLVVVERPTPVPYLVAVGPIAFRFAPPPPAQAEPPPAPPVPSKLAAAVVPPEPTSPLAPPPVAPPPPAPKVELPPDVREPANTSAPILPDDTKREIRAEDVLPFFQFPSSNAVSGGGAAPAFAPAQPKGSSLPPSSATYQQK